MAMPYGGGSGYAHAADAAARIRLRNLARIAPGNPRLHAQYLCLRINAAAGNRRSRTFRTKKVARMLAHACRKAGGQSIAQPRSRICGADANRRSREAVFAAQTQIGEAAAELLKAICGVS